MGGQIDAKDRIAALGINLGHMVDRYGQIALRLAVRVNQLAGNLRIKDLFEAALQGAGLVKHKKSLDAYGSRLKGAADVILAVLLGGLRCGDIIGQIIIKGRRCIGTVPRDLQAVPIRISVNQSLVLFYGRSLLT